ncbi:MAG: hypothetical protein ACW99A_00795 [Candidatus Kariarchaeaceae archaeon]|jgi:hypothetical protein
MSKSSVICEACGENNEPSSEFCIGCGAKVSVVIQKSTDPTSSDEEEKYKKDREKYFKELPTLIAVIVFLFFIDYVDGSGKIEWAYFPGAAIFLFAIAAPYFNFRRPSSNTD